MTYGKYLLLGTNLGDKQENLDHARTEISKIAPIVKASSIYETAAWGKTDQPSFYNQVIEISTNLLPEELLEGLLKIEDEMGRKRIEKWGTRIIDIDILYYDNVVINQDNLKIPHPGTPERKFTLVPLLEIAPDHMDPNLKMSNLKMLELLNDESLVDKL